GVEISLLLAGMVEQLLPVDQQQRDVGDQQGAEGVDAAPGLLRTADVLFEPFARVVVPHDAQRVHGHRLLGLRLEGLLQREREAVRDGPEAGGLRDLSGAAHPVMVLQYPGADRKSTRLNSSDVSISYAVFCLM